MLCEIWDLIGLVRYENGSGLWLVVNFWYGVGAKRCLVLGWWVLLPWRACINWFHAACDKYQVYRGSGSVCSAPAGEVKGGV